LTNTITLTPKWQASLDNSAWFDIKPENNAAYVVLQTSTGTGIANISAPRSIQGMPYVRFSLVSGVISGTAGDAYSMSYNYVRVSPFENTTFKW
jgi:hypothetical protein